MYFQLNRKCLDRGVFFTYVDLRWGITTEQTQDGKTIAICLQEVHYPCLFNTVKTTITFLQKRFYDYIIL